MAVVVVLPRPPVDVVSLVVLPMVLVVSAKGLLLLVVEVR